MGLHSIYGRSKPIILNTDHTYLVTSWFWLGYLSLHFLGGDYHLIIKNFLLCKYFLATFFWGSSLGPFPLVIPYYASRLSSCPVSLFMNSVLSNKSQARLERDPSLWQESGRCQSSSNMVFLKLRSYTGSIGTPWELDRSANSEAPQRNKRNRNSGERASNPW